jgi:hypothetical protein
MTPRLCRAHTEVIGTFAPIFTGSAAIVANMPDASK